MKSDRSKSNAGNGDWRKKQVEEVATAHTHPLVGPDGLANIGRGVRTAAVFNQDKDFWGILTIYFAHVHFPTGQKEGDVYSRHVYSRR